MSRGQDSFVSLMSSHGNGERERRSDSFVSLDSYHGDNLVTSQPRSQSQEKKEENDELKARVNAVRSAMQDLECTNMHIDSQGNSVSDQLDCIYVCLACEDAETARITAYILLQ